MFDMPAGGLAGRTAAALLLCFGLAVVQAITPKYACPITDRYCQLQAKYVFASAVIGNQVFYHGGLDANDANKPTNGTTIEMIDLTTLTPYMLPVQPAYALNASRYRHQLVSWRSKLVAVGGQADDQNGESRKVLSVIELDMATRQWELKRQFTQQRSSELIFEQSYIVNDTLYFIVQSLNEQSQSRLFYSLDLPTNKLSPGVPLCGEACFFRYKLSAAAVLDTGVYLTLQSLRVATPGNDPMVFLVTAPESETGFQGDSPLPYQFTSPLISTPGGSGGAVILNLNMLSFPELPPILVLWVSTKANFGRFGSSVPVSAVAVYALELSATLSVTASMQNLYVAVPTGYRLTDLDKIDLPKHGHVSVTPESRQIIEQMPYIGKVDLIGDLDYGNVAITQTPDGFVIRGTSKPEDPSCLPGDWKPFVMKFPMLADKPQVTAVSNYTFCSVSKQVRDLGVIRDDNFRAQAHRHLYAINGPTGQRVLQFAPQGYQQGEMFSTYYNAPMHGAFLDVTAATPEKMVTQFNITAGSNHKYPIEMASCMTQVGGVDTYVEYGGISRLDAAADAPISDVSLMSVTSNGVNMKIAPVSAALPARTAAAVGCSLDGRVYAFGGLQPTGTNDSYNATVYKPTADFNIIRFPGGAVKALPAKGPAPRHSHAMTYLNPDLVSGLGMKQGAVLLYGGANSSYPDLVGFWASNTTILKTMLLGDTWLYDIGADKWQELVLAPGSVTPPKMMWQVMTVHDKQVMMYGGGGYDPENQQWQQLRDIYILDFSLPKEPRWRVSSVVNSGRLSTQRTLYPNPGIVPLPQIDSLLIQSDQATSIVAIPRSVQTDGRQQQWDAYNRVLSSGDWLRLAPAGGRLQLATPLLVPGDITVTGVAATAAGRRLLAPRMPQPISVTCSNQTAFTTMSAGAALENMVISGCNQHAVLVNPDPAQSSSDDCAGSVFSAQPVTLRYITLTNNSGGNGSAVYVNSHAALYMERCMIKDNTVANASANSTISFKGIVVVNASSNLTMQECNVTNNSGPAVQFMGSQLVVAASRFQNNTAASGAAICNSNGNAGYSSAVNISHTTFLQNNASMSGGAVFAGAKCTINLDNATFIDNQGRQGGAVHIERDGCLGHVRNSNFSRNSAESHGGAVVAWAASSRCFMNWTNSTFTTNTAGGSGGAVYLSEVSNRVLTVSNTVFKGNKATGEHAGDADVGDGGGIYLGMWHSQVIFTNTTFSLNVASNRGGAMYLLGITSNLTLSNSIINSNTVPISADRGPFAPNSGGAIGCSGSLAHLFTTGCTFTNNTASLGGAICQVSQNGSLSVNNVTFTSNAAQGSTESYGGGVYVGPAIITKFIRVALIGNQAGVSGGGFACDGCASATITKARFESNTAPQGAGAALMEATQPSLISETVFDANIAGSPARAEAGLSRRRLAQVGTPRPVYNDAQAEANPNQANTNYLGGGGLYVVTAAVVNISNTNFTDNRATNGGGLLARTDSCPANSTDCKLLLTDPLFQNNNVTGAGAALLVTDLSASRASIMCSSNTSRQLDAVSVSQCSNGVMSPGELAGAAATAVLLNWTNADAQVANLTARTAAPGVMFTQALQLQDGLGRDVTEAAFPDAVMVMKAVLLYPNGTAVAADKFQIVGGLATAKNGLVNFTSIRIYGDSQNQGTKSYLLQFSAVQPNTVLQPSYLNITVRGCVAGEEIVTDGPGGTLCTPCLSPSYSFLAAVRGCVKCDSTDHAVCSRSYKIPEEGYWHSHPRNPQVHACLIPTACKPKHGAEALQNWAVQHAEDTTAQLTVTREYLGYVDQLCAEGYEGPLCGTCSPGHGRVGWRCSKCAPASVNSLLYFLACCYLFVLVAWTGFFHVKQVQRRQQQSFNAMRHAPSRGPAGVAGVPANQSVITYQNGGPPEESIPDASPDGLILSNKMSGPLVEVFTKDGQANYPAAGREDTYASNPISRYWRPIGAVAANGPPQEYETPPQQQPEQDVAPRQHISKAFDEHAKDQQPDVSTWFKKIFSTTDSKDTKPGTTLHPHLTPSMRTGQSTAPDSIEAQQYVTGTSIMTTGSTVTGSPSMNGPRRPTPRVQRAWVADCFKLLVSHVQMIGVLRNLQMQWPDALQKMVIYFDQTQSTNTWVSLDCSMTDLSDGATQVRRSVKRSLALLLLPVLGLLVACLYWAIFATYLRARRQPAPFRNYIYPRMIMSCILVLFYLYPSSTAVIVSLFSCTPVDVLANPAQMEDIMKYGESAAVRAVGDHWNQDTTLLCWQGTHAWLAYGFGIAGIVLFAVGFPIGIAYVLWRNRKRLQEQKVDLKYGFLYDSYRAKFYFWESVILLEKLALVMSVTLLQRYSAPLQILVAMAVIFVATAMQITFRPFCCRLLDTLQRTSLYVIQTTLFFTMIAAIPETDRASKIAALVIIGVINIGLVLLFLYAMYHECQRMLLGYLGKPDANRLTWADIKQFVQLVTPAGLRVFVSCGRGGRSKSVRHQAPLPVSPVLHRQVIEMSPPGTDLYTANSRDIMISPASQRSGDNAA